MFKVGDRVERIKNCEIGTNDNFIKGDVGTIIGMAAYGINKYKISCDRCPVFNNEIDARYLKLIEPTSVAKSDDGLQNIMNSLKQRVKMMFTGEPERSFIKAGIMNENKELTQDGKDIFIDFMFEKHKAEFKTEVVDKLLEEEDKK
jgi:hypothetical protein